MTISKDQIKSVEGAVSVDGDITPVTRQPIDRVNALEWSELSVGDLQAQLVTLTKRRETALSVGSISTAKAIDRGIAQLTQIINQKTQSKTSGETRLI